VLEWLRWYDRSRMHSTLNYSSPAEYEQRWAEKQIQAAARFSGDRSRRRKYGNR
jgi:hypothetical protein